VGVSLWVMFWVFVVLCFLFVFLFLGVHFVYSLCTQGRNMLFFFFFFLIIKFDLTCQKRNGMEGKVLGSFG
jgi:apolipoprotein N-acyltransferase